MLDLLALNMEWTFSGAGIALIGIIAKLFLRFRGQEAISKTTLPPITINNSNQNHTYSSTDTKSIEPKEKSLQDFKAETKILFIDDDPRFKVTKILSKSGWIHTRLIKDAETLETSEIIDAHILFIDVQGVGVAMGFSDEGLGLALAIKRKYPSKKVIIYSAETQGDRFHEALRSADNFLPKNADPYEFQKIVEEYTIGNRAY